MAQTLKFGKGTWATKTGSSMAYNDQNGNYKPLPFNVERDSIATRVNKQGLIEVVGKDKLRIDYTDSAKGVALLEPSRTNLVAYSESLQSSWISSGTNPPVITASQFISPDGTQNASRLQIPSTNTISIFQQLFSHTYQTQYTISAYVKSNTSTNQQFKLYGDYGTPTGISGVLTATSEWQRFSFTYTATATGSRSGGFYYVPNTAADLQVYGIQVEIGSYSTSFIPTSDSTVQRQADVVNGSGNSEVFNDSSGVLFAEISALANDGTFKFISLSDNSLNNVVWIYYRSEANQINFRILVGGVTSFDQIYTINDATRNAKLALKYKENDFSAWVNGFKVFTDTSGSIFPIGTLKNLEFNRPDDTNFFYGKTKEIGYYDEILTDAELEYMTSYRSLNEMVTELNLNAL